VQTATIFYLCLIITVEFKASGVVHQFRKFLSMHKWIKGILLYKVIDLNKTLLNCLQTMQLHRATFLSVKSTKGV